MSCDEVWDNIDRAYTTSRKANREVMDDQLGAMMATSMVFNNAMLIHGLVGSTIDVETDQPPETEAPENP